jgi:8-oxo-dGTP diphosphatase
MNEEKAHLPKIEVVAAVIEHDGAFLATQRGYGEQAGGWEFPGGKIEPGETPQQALAREIGEELDTRIAVGELLTVIEYDYPAFHLRMQCFRCRIVEGTPVLKEHEAARWLGPEDLDSVDWLPADRTILALIRDTLIAEALR